ncbi:MAG: anti-phage BREX system Lon protease BrxL, partial [Promethearchaeota archaeon]
MSYFPDNSENSIGVKKNKSYEKKVKAIFQEAAINKALVHDSRARDLPRYIFEWLLSKHENNGTLTPEAKRRLFNLIEEHFPDSEFLETYKNKIIKYNEKIIILNPFRVTLDARSEMYNVYFPFFASESRNVGILDEIISQNKKLLENEVWGLATITKGPIDGRPFLIKEF